MLLRDALQSPIAIILHIAFTPLFIIIMITFDSSKVLIFSLHVHMHFDVGCMCLNVGVKLIHNTKFHES